MSTTRRTAPPSAASTRVRMGPDERQCMLLEVALAQAEKHGLRNITRGGIAEAAGCSSGLITKYLGDRKTMQTALVKLAVKKRIIPIVATALADGYPAAKRAPDDLKAEAAAYLTRA